ncbi:MAG TPA: MFS transporter [Pyrinomonadaceae bacterium]|jgi:MFS family permease
MGETDTDAADQFDARVGEGRLDESRPGLWRRLSRLPRNVVAIGVVSLLNDASSEIIYPMLPAFLALALGASPRAIGVVEGVAESVSSLLKLLSGYLSDRTGRRKGLVVVGYGLASVMRPLLALATTWYQVLFVRFTDRVGKGLRSSPRDAMIADAAPPAERGLAFGFHRAMDHGGAVLGPLIGLGLLWLVAADPRTPTAADYSTIFLFASVPALLAMLVLVYAVRESRAGAAGAKDGGAREGASAPAAGGTKMRLTLRGFDANFKWFLVLVALFTLSNSTDAFLIRRAQMAGVSTGQGTLLLWSALHLSKVVSSVVGGDLSDRLGRKTLIVAGWLLYAAVYLGFAHVSTPAGAWSLFLVYGVYFGLAEGAEKALVADLVRPEQRGTAYGLYNLAFGITVLPASLLMGALWDAWSPETAFFVSAAIGTTAALLLALFVKPGVRALH